MDTPALSTLDTTSLAIASLGEALALLARIDAGDLAQAREIVELVRINLAALAAQGQPLH